MAPDGCGSVADVDRLPESCQHPAWPCAGAASRVRDTRRAWCFEVRLVWNSLAESLLLALAGAVAGVFLASAALSLFRHHSPVDLPRLAQVHLNGTVLLFSACLLRRAFWPCVWKTAVRSTACRCTSHVRGGRPLCRCGSVGCIGAHTPRGFHRSYGSDAKRSLTSSPTIPRLSRFR